SSWTMSRRRMTIQRTGGDGAKVALIIYTLLFWVSGLALLVIGLWMLLDPKRNYILDLVNFSEDDPLLTFAAYIAVVAGGLSLVVGFIGCCGAVQRMRCLLVGFMICLFVLFLADVSIGTLALVYRNKFTNGRLTVYLKNMTHNRYNRDEWVKPLLDTVQFYQQCCGGESARDYYGSFWFITNTDRGTRSFVPTSCCRQAQVGRAWAPVPIDPMCTTYAYDSQAFDSSVHKEGCHEKLLAWLDEQTYIFAGVGFGFAALMVIGMTISLVMCNSVRYYTFVRDKY
uniref:Tetraspanin n=1 Tax=Haemonchus contortus TaxID=6289 RepID=A0A7I4Y6F0_HAECO